MEYIIGIILLVLVSSYILSEIAKKFNLPKIIGSLFAGLILGLPMIQHTIFNSDMMYVLETFSEIGLIFLMFYIGMSLDLSKFNRNEKHKAFHLAIAGFGITLLLGFLSSYFLFNLELSISLIIGVALSVTSESTSVQILKERKLVNSKITRMIMGGGIINDLIGVISIAILVSLFGTGQNTILNLILNLGIFIILVYLSEYLIIPVSLNIARKEKKTDLFITSIMIAMMMAFLSTILGLDSVLGALLGGMLVRYILLKKRDKKDLITIENMIEGITFGYFSTFFFVYVGMQSNFAVLFTNPILILVFTVLAMLGMLIGSYITTRSFTIGMGLNSRDAMGIVIATIAFTNGLIPIYIFNILIFISFFTAIITPMLFDFMIKLKYK